MVLRNCTLLDADFRLKKGCIRIEDGVIAEIAENIEGDYEYTDCEGMYAVPGFIDLHTHGCVGNDSADAVDGIYDEMSKFYASHGVTTYLATVVTSSREVTAEAVKVIKNTKTSGAKVGGIYLEGPYFCEKYKGAQNASNMRLPDIAELNELCDVSGGIIKVISLAPELDGAYDFIREVSGKVKVALGHTDADSEISGKAIDSGATIATHLFNAMRPLHHREPNLVGTALDRAIYCECICDGIHLNMTTVRLVYKLIGDEKMVLVSDSLRAAGLKDGEYTLGGLDVFVKNGVARLSDGTIAGSTANLHQCVKNIVAAGIPFESACKMASYTPAVAAGLDRVGCIKEGNFADILILDSNYDIVKVFVDGKEFKN